MEKSNFLSRWNNFSFLIQFISKTKIVLVVFFYFLQKHINRYIHMGWGAPRTPLFGWYFEFGNMGITEWCLERISNLSLGIQMSHWCHTMLDGTKFWISCKQPARRSSSSHLQMIPNLVPSTIVWYQFDMGILRFSIEENFAFLRKCNSYS